MTDPRFSRGGANLRGREGGQPKRVIWHKFCRKLHEHEKNWTERGPRVPSTPRSDLYLFPPISCLDSLSSGSTTAPLSELGRLQNKGAVSVYLQWEMYYVRGRSDSRWTLSSDNPGVKFITLINSKLWAKKKLVDLIPVALNQLVNALTFYYHNSSSMWTKFFFYRNHSNIWVFLILNQNSKKS